MKAAMTPRQFRTCLKQADVNRRRFARWLGLAPMTVYRWADDSDDPHRHRDIPQYVAVLANLIARYPKIAAEARNSE
jgi:hypothetical protein